MSAVSLTKHNSIAAITVNNPPVNAISATVRSGMHTFIRQLQTAPEITAIIIICEGRTFMAGADIKEFGLPPAKPTLRDVAEEIENSCKPIIAAIHGNALGGGFEIALASHYRIADQNSKMGLPEVTLGVIPGAGGTQRLPRLIGLQKSIDMIISGKPINTAQALEAGAIDRVSENDLLLDAISFAEHCTELRKSSEMIAADANQCQQLIADTRQATAKRFTGQPAFDAALTAISAVSSETFTKGLEIEGELFQDCRNGSESRALRHIFFAERETRKIPDIDKSVQALKIETTAVIGAGTMGSAISMCFAEAGIPVTLLETSDQALQAGLDRIKHNYEQRVSRGKLSLQKMDQYLSLVTGSLQYAALSDCDLIIEAIFEDINAKQSVFTQLDEVAKPSAILASNTSYLNLNTIANFTSRPANVIGLHFFSPANVMKLLEIVKGDSTSPQVLKTAVDIGKRIKKVTVISKVCHGFIGNRMLSAYVREAALCAVQARTPKVVDNAMTEFGMRMGPLAVLDMAGLDIGYKNRKALRRDKYQVTAYDWIDTLVEQGNLGIKSGAGIYQYEAGSRTPTTSQNSLETLAKHAQEAMISERTFTNQEIIERCIYSLINEGANILNEGIALRASDIDVVYCMGYGFPKYKGGPMKYAEEIGIDKVLKKIEAFAEELGGKWWTPSPLLYELKQSGKTFSDFNE